MAWNDSGSSGGPTGGGDNRDPGRGGNRNPWGKRPQQGPPDLDQWVRNLQRKLAGIFGGGGGNGRTPDTNGGGGLGMGVIFAVLLVVWFASGFYMVDPAERAVILRFGKFDSIQGPGPHVRLPWPIDSKMVINIERIESYTDQTRMLTSDENMVDINVEVQFRRADPKAFAFNVKDPEATLREVSESAIRETIGRSKLEDVLEAGRQKIGTDTRDLIQSTLTFYKTGIEVTSLNLQDVKVPEQVAPAQQDAIKAGKDKERFGLEAQTYANDILPKARGATARQVQDAQAYRARKIADSEGETARFTKLLSEYERAPAVTRQRLYLETVESVLGNSKKVLLDAKGSGNMLYLPIDKMMEQRAGSTDPGRDAVSVTRGTTPIGTVEVTPDDRRSRGTR